MISRATARHYTWGGRCDGWYLVQADELSVIHERMPPDTAEVRHHHRAARQFFFILSGVATMEHGDERVELRGGEGVEIAPGVPHRISNASGQAVEFLVVSAPPSQGDRILDLGDAPLDSEAPADRGTPASRPTAGFP